MYIVDRRSNLNELMTRLVSIWNHKMWVSKPRDTVRKEIQLHTVGQKRPFWP